MAKLTVKNVGPIREADFEVKKHTVFIGPQGSGKSTLAKLIAIGSDTELVLANTVNQKVISKYGIQEYVESESIFNYEDVSYNLNLTNFHIEITILEKSDKLLISNETLDAFQQFISSLKSDDRANFSNYSDTLPSHLSDSEEVEILVKNFYGNFQKEFIPVRSIYVPAERTLIALFNEVIWSLVYSDINFPKTVASFASKYSQASYTLPSVLVPFLGIKYRRTEHADYVSHNENKFIKLAQSASGYQSIIPLLLVIEHQRQQFQRRFIIEEPELNLYPTAQKDLIYALMSGLDPNIEYQDAEWLITTHSPYVLSSFNTLMLAYKVAQKSDELRAEVEKIIPARCWINPDEFAAYYVDNGTVRNIISEKTGLIADNELDDVSEDLAGEQDQLLELYRNIPSA